jgi:hypothetical protein
MKELEQIDISGYSYDEFMSFVFDHTSSEDEYRPWYFDVEVTFDAVRVCEFHTRLFRNPGFLLRKYSKPQLARDFCVFMDQPLTVRCST